MLKTDPDSSTSTPLWLALTAIFFFGLRWYMVNEEIHHPKPSTLQINWHKPHDEKLAGNEPLLYFFTSPGLGSCQELEAGCFHNKALVNKINDNFFPILVEHVSAPKQPVPSEILELEDRYTVLTLPELVVALPPDEKIKSSMTKVKLRDVDVFLDEALMEIPYAKACTAFGAGKLSEAADLFGRYITKAGYKNNNASTACIRRYCCLKLTGKNEEALACLREGEEKIDDEKWAYHIAQFLSGKITDKELEVAAGNDKIQRIDCHFYRALLAFADKQLAKAKPDLEWILKLNSFKAYSEVKLTGLWLDEIVKAEKNNANSDKKIPSRETPNKTISRKGNLP